MCLYLQTDTTFLKSTEAQSDDLREKITSALLEWKMFKYELVFTPEVESMASRKYLINTQRTTLGSFLFKGTELLLFKRFEEERGSLSVRGQNDGIEYTISFRLVAIAKMLDPQSSRLFNLFLHHVMNHLDFGNNWYKRIRF